MVKAAVREKDGLSPLRLGVLFPPPLPGSPQVGLTSEREASTAADTWHSRLQRRNLAGHPKNTVAQGERWEWASPRKSRQGGKEGEPTALLPKASPRKPRGRGDKEVTRHRQSACEKATNLQAGLTFASGPTCWGDLRQPSWAPGGRPHLQGCWADWQPPGAQLQTQASGCSLRGTEQGGWAETGGEGQRRRWR